MEVTKRKKSKVRKISMIILAIFVILFIVLFVFLNIISPGKLRKSTYEVNEKIFLEIGGIKQGAFIVGENKENPVLLFLHGGPGAPEYALSRDSFIELEKEFTICYWDQRGAGMSFNSKMTKETVTKENMIQDTIEITNYLKDRFKKEKIYLLGHSWGSYLGVKVISERPELYHAYIGVGQVSNQAKSEEILYKKMIEEATKENDKEAIKEIQKYKVTENSFPESKYITSIRSKYLDKYKIGVSFKYGKKGTEELYENLFKFEGYTLKEKINHVRGMLFSLKNIFKYTLEENLMETAKEFEVPVYFLVGKNDYQVSWELAEQYFEMIRTEKKEFYFFEESAHCPFIDENEKFVEVMKEIKATK